MSAIFRATRPSLNRRQFLARGTAGLTAWGTLGLTGLGVPWGCSAPVLAAEVGKSAAAFRVADVQRTTVKLPFRPAPQRAMDRELPHWRYSEVFQVTLESGARGIGETLLFYTWGVSDDAQVQRVLRHNAVDLMWDDSLGAGLQMALFDAVARTAGVPVHRLLGRQVHQQTPLSWWNIDMEPSDLAAECALAHQQGYTALKTKGRPWFDIWQQVEAVSQAVPESFALDMDFNDTLRTAERAIPLLLELEKNPRMKIYETPIPQRDVEGNRKIREATSVAIALHYGTPSPAVTVRQQVCDGFVIGGGASRVSRQGAMAAEVDLPFWLQLVGTDITAAFSMHFGAVLSHATWPAVNCHQLYARRLLTEPIQVQDGLAQVPDRPGLGFDLDVSVLEELQVEKPAERPEPRRLLEVQLADGTRIYVASNGQVNFMLTAANREQLPFFARGVTTRLLPDDGSAAWKRRYEQSQERPSVERPR